MDTGWWLLPPFIMPTISASSSRISRRAIAARWTSTARFVSRCCLWRAAVVPRSQSPDLGAWGPPAGILADYEKLWLPTSDAPRVYHVACSLAVVAAAVENRAYLPFGG